MEHQTTKPEWILKLLQIIPMNCWINCKTNVSIERLNSRVEFHGKMTNLSTKNLDKLINWQFAFTWTECYELFDVKPC